MAKVFDSRLNGGPRPFRNAIERLNALENHTHRVLSLFLTLDQTTPEGRNQSAQLHDALQPMRRRFPNDSQLLDEVERATALIAGLPSDARAAAVFTCPQTDFALALPLPSPVPARVYWDRRAWLGPLRDLANVRNWLLLLVADKREGRFLVSGFGTIHELSNVTDSTPGKHAAGAEAQSNIMRHHDEWVRQHARHISRELELLGRTLTVGGLAISAPPEMLAVLQDELPARFAGFPLDMMHVAADAPAEEILEHARSLIERRRENFESALMETLSESIGRNRAAVGLNEVVASIVARQVQVLICADRADLRGSVCNRCELILPVEHRDVCPVCGSSVVEQPDFTEYLADRVWRQGGSFEYVHEAAAQFLHGNGNIAALLRYVAPEPAGRPGMESGNNR